VSVVFASVGAIFVNPGMALGSCFFQMLLLETRLSISCQNVSASGLNLGIWCCWCCRHRFFVVVTVDRVLTFVGEGHGVSQSDSSLLCRVRSYARVEDLRFLLLAHYWLESICSVWRVMLSMAWIPWFVLLYFCFVQVFVTALRGW
jgi:hypothetical protein